MEPQQNLDTYKLEKEDVRTELGEHVVAKSDAINVRFLHVLIVLAAASTIVGHPKVGWVESGL